MSAKVFAMPISPEMLARVAAAGDQSGAAAASRRCIGAAEGVIFLPMIRRDDVRAEPSLAEQALAVEEMYRAMRDDILPRATLVDLRDGAVALDRLFAAASTLRRLAEQLG